MYQMLFLHCFLQYITARPVLPHFTDKETDSKKSLRHVIIYRSRIMLAVTDATRKQDVKGLDIEERHLLVRCQGKPGSLHGKEALELILGNRAGF